MPADFPKLKMFVAQYFTLPVSENSKIEDVIVLAETLGSAAGLAMKAEGRDGNLKRVRLEMRGCSDEQNEVKILIPDGKSVFRVDHDDDRPADFYLHDDFRVLWNMLQEGDTLTRLPHRVIL